jgi:hypothetical protein
MLTTPLVQEDLSAVCETLVAFILDVPDILTALASISTFAPVMNDAFFIMSILIGPVPCNRKIHFPHGSRYPMLPLPARVKFVRNLTVHTEPLLGQYAGKSVIILVDVITHVEFREP